MLCISHNGMILSKYMTHAHKAEKERAAKQMAALKSQLETRRRHDYGSNPFAAGGGGMYPAQHKVGEHGEDDDGGCDDDQGYHDEEGGMDQHSLQELHQLRRLYQEISAEKVALEQDLKYAMGELEVQRRKQFGPFDRNQFSPQKTASGGGGGGGDFNELSEKLRISEGKMSELSQRLQQCESDKLKLETQNNALNAILMQFQMNKVTNQMVTPPTLFTAVSGSGSGGGGELEKIKETFEKEKQNLEQQISNYREQISLLESDKLRITNEFQKQAREKNDEIMKLHNEIQLQQLNFAKHANQQATDFAKRLALDPNTVLTKKCEELGRKIESMELRNSLREQSIAAAVKMAQDQGSLEIKRLQSIHAMELAEKVTSFAFFFCFLRFFFFFFVVSFSLLNICNVCMCIFSLFFKHRARFCCFNNVNVTIKG
jgi:DNA repair exonuclease SbcCD ATPase subunit